MKHYWHKIVEKITSEMIFETKTSLRYIYNSIHGVHAPPNKSGLQFLSPGLLAGGTIPCFSFVDKFQDIDLKHHYIHKDLYENWTDNEFRCNVLFSLVLNHNWRLMSLSQLRCILLVGYNLSILRKSEGTVTHDLDIFRKLMHQRIFLYPFYRLILNRVKFDGKTLCKISLNLKIMV